MLATNTSTPEITKTTCPYCGVGCGVEIHKSATGDIQVKPDKSHPANLGRLCSKGSALADTLEHPDRLLFPKINNQRVDWDTATSTVANKINSVIQEHGADAVAFYVSGQLSTEDYYVANKLMKGYIGSANIDTNSRLCMASAVVAHKRAFGEDLVSCSYEDLEIADLIVLVGSNTAWCHPVLYQRIAKAKKGNPNLKIVLIDPRKTQTANIADLHLDLEPGTDATLFNGLLSYLHQHEFIHQDFVDNHTEGFNAAIDAAIASSPDTSSVAKQCGLSLAKIEQFFALFASTEKAITVFSQGINQSSSGVDKGNALINCHLLTGRIGQPGMGAFSFTGQPNAMGGREVGGLANQLAAHMDIDNPSHRDKVQRFWQSPTIATKQGFKAVDLFDAINDGKIKLLWVIATNPAASLPDAHKVRAALEKCETLIVSDCVKHTDTIAYADILLPAKTWGERNGTVTNSDRTISRQRPFFEAPDEAKGDWEILTAVAQSMGHHDAFPYKHPADVFREHAALSSFENDNERCFDIGSLSQIEQTEYDAFSPQPWPLKTGQTKESIRLFEDSQFFTKSRKAQFIAITPKAPASLLSKQYPFRLNTGRVRDHWHTLTRTGISARLSSHIEEPYVEIHPQDAKPLSLQNGQIARIWNELGEVHVKVSISDDQRVGSLFIPMHWSDTFNPTASISKIIPSIVDPYSGQPESKHASVQIEGIVMQWHGFLLSKEPLDLPTTDYINCNRVKNGWQYELCGTNFDHFEQLKALLACQSDVIEYQDTNRQIFRAASFRGKQLSQCLFISDQKINLPKRKWLTNLLSETTISQEQRSSLLSGNPPTAIEDQGKTVCSCFNVGEKTIMSSISEQKLTSVEAIGECTQAGTNCGSCIPELNAYLSNG